MILSRFLERGTQPDDHRLISNFLLELLRPSIVPNYYLYLILSGKKISINTIS
jgi:hypothetical protein